MLCRTQLGIVMQCFKVTTDCEDTSNPCLPVVGYVFFAACITIHKRIIAPFSPQSRRRPSPSRDPLILHPPSRNGIVFHLIELSVSRGILHTFGNAINLLAKILIGLRPIIMLFITRDSGVSDPCRE
jgi:hypothetical protein